MMSEFDAEIEAKKLLANGVTLAKEQRWISCTPFRLGEDFTTEQSQAIATVLKQIASGSRYAVQWNGSEFDKNEKPGNYRFGRKVKRNLHSFVVTPND